MLKLLGFLIVILSVGVGYVLSHGKLMALWQPFEILIICGAAIGAFCIANPWDVQKAVLREIPALFWHKPHGGAFFMQLLGLIYELLNKSRREGMMAIEADLDEPRQSDLFRRFPAIVRNDYLTDFIADYLRLMASGNMAAHELEALFDMEVETRMEELQRPAHALGRVADALPGFGIVAAVLGIVITMQSMGGPPDQLGLHVAAALVGTFIGILLAYGFVGPLSQALESRAHEEINACECVKACLVAAQGGMPPALAVEFGRKTLFSSVRPSFQALERHLRGR